MTVAVPPRGPVPPPPPPAAVAREPWWRAPAGPAPAWVVGAAVPASGLAFGFADALPPGLGLVLVELVVAAVAVRVLWPVRDAGDRLLLVLGVALGAVAVLRDSPWLVLLCTLGALGLLMYVTVGGRRWPSALLAPFASALASLRALPWVARRMAAVRRPEAAWVRGGVVGALLVWAVGALLASGDPVFAGFLSRLLPSFSVDLMPLRVMAALFTLLVVLGVAYCAAAPPTWIGLTVPPAQRPAAEWGLPLALLDGLLALWVGLQAALLFGGAEVLVGNSLTYADRARQGFFQLVVVTLLVLVVLGWAAHCAGRSPRAVRLLGGLGGLLVVLTLVVVASALRRMWLYEQAYGWTVLRVVVAAFELWLAAVILLLCGAWFVGRTAASARLVVAAAGVGLLALALVGPDALVARLSGERAASGRPVDPYYLSALSADATADLVRLPPKIAVCVFSARSGGQVLTAGPAPDPWYGWNLARSNARAALAAHPLTANDLTGAGCG